MKPAFRDAFRNSRCLVVADGFYTWKKVGTARHPFFVRMNADEGFAIAGLAEHWRRNDRTINSCAVITTEANPLVAEFDDRMPAILALDDLELWLESDFHGQKDLLAMLRPHPAEHMIAHQVGTLVDDARNDDPACIQPD